jgi:pimeloyl-ACP methyl ester carboxylesterase
MVYSDPRRTTGASVSEHPAPKLLPRSPIDSWNRALASDLRRPVYAVDLRNHGDSPHHPTHDYVAMADDVAGFIEEHKLKDTTLIGHSMLVLLLLEACRTD